MSFYPAWFKGGLPVSIGGTVRSSAKLLGSGTAATPTTASTAGNFIEWRYRNSVAAGEVRGIYNRLYLSGASGGESFRTFTTVEAAAGTAHGAHISLNFAAAPAALSGLGVAMRGTLHIPDRAIALGTVAAVQAEVYMDGNSADPTATSLALFRGIVDGGNQAAKRKVTTFLDLTCETGAHDAGYMHATTNSGTITEALKIVVNGDVRYIPLLSALVAP